MPNGQPRRSLDASRAKELFGFEARTPLREGLERTIAWYRAQAPRMQLHAASLSRARPLWSLIGRAPALERPRPAARRPVARAGRLRAQRPRTTAGSTTRAATRPTTGRTRTCSRTGRCPSPLVGYALVVPADPGRALRRRERPLRAAGGDRARTRSSCSRSRCSACTGSRPGSPGASSATGRRRSGSLIPYVAIPMFDQRYHEKYVEHHAAAVARADRRSATSRRWCFLLVTAYLLVRALDTRDWRDAVLAGLVGGFAIGLKPSNALFFGAAVLCLLVARRWAQIGRVPGRARPRPVPARALEAARARASCPRSPRPAAAAATLAAIGADAPLGSPALAGRTATST